MQGLDLASAWLDENAGALKDEDTLAAIKGAIQQGKDSSDPAVKEAAKGLEKKLNEIVKPSDTVEAAAVESKETKPPSGKKLQESFDAALDKGVGSEEYKALVSAFSSDISRAFAQSRSQLSRESLTADMNKDRNAAATAHAKALTRTNNQLAMMFDQMLLNAADPAKGGSPEKYAKALCFINDLAVDLAQKDELDGVWALYQGKNTAAQGKLQSTQFKKTGEGKEVSSEVKKQLETRSENFRQHVDSLTNPNKNYAAFRERAQQKGIPLPFFKASQDRTFGVEANPAKEKYETTVGGEEGEFELPGSDVVGLLSGIVSSFMKDIPRQKKLAEQEPQSSLAGALESGGFAVESDDNKYRQAVALAGTE